ncbi:MAG: AGE family epimerase/isomerase, partial [Vitreimonas sp.]
GGTRHLLGPDGAPADERRDLYDLAFVVYALAEAAQALGDRSDLIEAAEALVAWAEANWSDPQGGFREGDVTPVPPRRQNPHMHLFEALLALHEASGKREHLERANAIGALFAEKLFDLRHGALPEYFDDSWRPQDERICEPGHHFEWAWLLDRWRRLGGGDLSAEAERLRVHGEVYGVELRSGAIYDEVFADGRPRSKTSRLWPHTERIKANVARFARTRDVAAADAAVEAFDMLMRYCDTPIPGLWRDRRMPDGSFVEEAAPASSFYHVVLALSELIRVADELELGG